ncbi:MAG: Lon protease family protein [Anaerolineae bacterium]
MEQVKEPQTKVQMRELRPHELYRAVDTEQFDFETTADLSDLEQFIGQPRAVDAMEFGMGIKKDGYNVFALGPAGTGKQSFVQESFERQAAHESVPSDWLYVNNFEEQHKPWAIKLPAGQGAAFRRDMEHLVEETRGTLSAAFESEEYQTRRQAAMEVLKQKQNQAFEELQVRAQERNVTLLRTPAGLAVAPVRNGEVMSPDDVQRLSPEERQRLEHDVEDLQGQMQAIFRQVPTWQREVRDRIRELDREVSELAVGGLINDLCDKYAQYQEVVDYLTNVKADVVGNARELMPQEEDGTPQAAMMQRAQGSEDFGLRRYKVNLLVDNSESKGAPVIYEDNPSYQNLIGRVEHLAQMGALITDFSLIKPGALHRANGGYLLLDARKVLTQPYAWEALKRALQSNELRVESVGQMLSLISTVSLEPEPIPLQVKVALLGDRELYYLLWQLDPDFPELFKVMVDFEETIDRDPTSHRLYAQLIATLAREAELRPFSRGAVARVIERSARMVGDAEKLSITIMPIKDLIRESDYWAGRNGHVTVAADDVDKAIEAQIHRSDRLRERSQESILRDIMLIDTEGAQVGQVNGLTVMQLGGFAFGRPSRITASIRMGRGEVVDIEREVELGGPIHSKGVLILSGYLGGRYAEEQPLSLSASLVFEQSYGGVEGDSASSAELYALLSAISEAPIRQSLAVTGSVNQVGQVQPIGGVNEKIEGFFDVCNSRGLTGDQGVLIPIANTKHLMLRRDVVDAVEAGRFHIYPITTIDQGISLLTGIPAGERGEDGSYPPDSINGRVANRLAELAEKQMRFKEQAKEDGRGA